MKQSSVSFSTLPERILIDTVSGDLQVIGWERNEANARTDGDELTMTFLDGIVHIAECDSDLILYVPYQANLKFENVGGDADFRALAGDLEIVSIGGDLQLRDVGAVIIDNVGGDLSGRGVKGDIKIENIGGDASLRQVHGNVQVANVGGDYYLRDATASTSVNSGSDAVIFIRPMPGETLDINAGGDVLLRVPTDATATFTLNAGGDIRTNLPGVQSPEEGMNTYVFSMGNGDALVNVSAGGDVVVTTSADEWQSMAEFDSRGWDENFGIPPVPPIPPIPPIPPVPPIPSINARGVPPDLSERINQKIAEATRRAEDASRRATERSFRSQERAQARVEAAMRRAEEKMRAAERRAAQMGVSMGRPGFTPERSYTPPPPSNQPVSDEERLTILRMLQEKKITVQDAEKLLAALEGK